VKHFDNLSIFGRYDMDKSLRYYLGHPADVLTDCPQGILVSTMYWYRKIYKSKNKMFCNNDETTKSVFTKSAYMY